jgi:type IV pilus assembly protein PilZ
MSQDAGQKPQPGGGSSRPGVLQLVIKEAAALQSAYMPFLAGGGLFIPTTRPASLGEEVFLSLQLCDDPVRYSVNGRIAWITPAGTPGRQQGIGVQFARDEAGTQLRDRIETLIGGLPKSNRPNHTL